MPTGATSATVKRAVLHLTGGPVDRDVVEFGIKLARADSAELVAVYVVEVDWRHDLDDELDSQREVASRALDVAEGLAERAKVRLGTQLLQARDVGAALVDEAVALDADVVVVGLPYRGPLRRRLRHRQDHPVRVPERALQGRSSCASRSAVSEAREPQTKRI